MENKIYYNKETRKMIKEITNSAVYVLDIEKLLPNNKDSDELKNLKLDEQHMNVSTTADCILDNGEIMLVINGKHYFTDIEKFKQALKDI